MKKVNNRGFTLIELMIATTVLAILLLLIAAVSIQIGKLFYKGVSSSRTQESARNISSLVTRQIQYSAQTPVSVTVDSYGILCVGKTRYFYQQDTATNHAQVGPSQHALWVDDQSAGPSCNTTPTSGQMETFMEAASPTPKGRELVPSGMRLAEFTVVNSGKYWNLGVGVALGDEELLERTPADTGPVTGCVSSTLGGQFCDVASLKVGVYRWL